MSAGRHQCSHGSLEDVSAIEQDLLSRGFVKSGEDQSQKNIPAGEYMIVCIEKFYHHRNGEIPYRIAWVETGE